MERKTLIFGCSLTAGSYEKNSDSDGDDLHSNIGWYNYVKQLADKSADIYAFGGGGYTDWAQVLCYLRDKQQLADYDRIIIAETNNRFTLWLPDFNPARLPVSSNNENNVSVKVLHNYGCWTSSIVKHPDMFKKILGRYDCGPAFYTDGFVHDVCASPSMKFYEEATVSYMRGMLLDLGIKTYIFSFFEPMMAACGDSIQRLDHGIYDKLLASNSSLYLTNATPYGARSMAHQNIDGNRAIGHYVSEMIEQG